MGYETVISGEIPVTVAATKTMQMVFVDDFGDISRTNTPLQVSIAAGTNKVFPLLAFHRQLVQADACCDTIVVLENVSATSSNGDTF